MGSSFIFTRYFLCFTCETFNNRIAANSSNALHHLHPAVAAAAAYHRYIQCAMVAGEEERCAGAVNAASEHDAVRWGGDRLHSAMNDVKPINPFANLFAAE